MSRRQLSWTAALVGLRADRTVAKPLALDWSKADDKHGLMIWHGRRDGQLLGFVNLDGAKHHANVFIPGTIDDFSVGTFPMSPVGLRAAQRAVEAAVLAQAAALTAQAA